MKLLQFSLIGITAVIITLVAFSEIASLGHMLAPRLLEFGDKHAPLLSAGAIMMIAASGIISRIRKRNSNA